MRNWDFIDLFAGVARITTWALKGGLCGAAIDVVYGDHMDITSTVGFALSILAVLRLVPRGLLFMAAPCSSWVWVNRKTSKRSKEHIMGDDGCDFVRAGNLCNERVSILCDLARMCGAYWVIEQPISSLFFQTPHMLSTIANRAAERTSFPMSSFGHAAEKMTQLVGTTDWLPQMSRKRAKTPSKTPSPAKAKARATEVRAKAKANLGVQKGARATGKTATTEVRAKAKAKAKTIRAYSGVRMTATSGKTKHVLGDQINKGGKRTYNGNKGKLKVSQVYLVKFALAIVQNHWPGRFGAFAEQQ